MSSPKYVTLTREAREDLVRLLEGLRPGDTPSALAWGRSKGAALRRLADLAQPLDEALALRLDALVRQGRRQSLGTLSPGEFRALRAKVGRYLDESLDEIAEAPLVHDVVRRAA